MPARAGEARDLTKPTIRQIVKEVAKKHNLAVGDLCGPNQYDHFVIARHEAMWRCRHETHRSFPIIGRFFNRDHTTVVYAVAKLDGNPKWRPPSPRQ